jgi:hypothetical protein
MDLGELHEVFERRNPYKLVAYIWFVFGACGLLAFSARPHLSRDGSIILAFSLGMIGLGVLWLRSFSPLRLEIRERGLVYRGRAIAYGEMKSIVDRRAGNYRFLRVETGARPFDLHGEIVGDALLDKVRAALRDHGGPTVN